MKVITLIAGILSVLILMLSGPLYQAEVLELRQAFMGFRVALIVGAIVLVLVLIQVIFMRKNIVWSTIIFSTLLALVAVGFPLGMMNKGKSVPAIHDITTDLVNPPKFNAILALRADAPNPAAYQGEEIASQQRSAYPELQTQTYSQSSDLVFDATLESVKNMGLEVVTADKATGQIEAYDTTAWFGFIDDVVIRIQSQAGETILDVRSKSRIGRSDLGKNAERIREILDGIALN
ncbi:DUF1499 domain-containing protein [uncultured Paraglaciecola sp.]|uniref:DUF1499 domain-containing protein n=1 Tax=uncultured Paraglaciecola sp. TaxID=1765024 RepID=UPI00259395B4|nr:DUF1499 domain-containing protein [uncultured Paraglaciecola sp.]